MDINLKYKQNQNVDPAPSSDAYSEESYARHISFITSDLHKKGFYYSSLITIDEHPETASLVLTFTTHIVTLTGIRLGQLYSELLAQLPKVLRCTEERYNQTEDNNQPIINAIDIRPLQDPDNG